MTVTNAISMVANLCTALRAEGVDYCHWKSNAAIDRTARGETDLDLLVRRSDAGTFAEIMARLGFRYLTAPSSKAMPGVDDFYGYDADADAFVHVQAHYQLILGHDRTKNYRIPIEEAYLESAFGGEVFRLPAPEFEYVVLVLRMVLKYATWDAIVGRQGVPKASEVDELAFLEERIDTSRVGEIIERHLPQVGRELFEACRAALVSGTPAIRRIKTADRLEQALQGHARHRRPVDAYLRLWRRLLLGIRYRVFGHTPRYRLSTGGAIIAILGGDGSGKTTAIVELNRWLGRELDTREIHLGKPNWSLTTRIVRGGLKVVRRVVPGVDARQLSDISSTGPLSVNDYTQIVWEACTARDRHLTSRKARRFATSGGLVISDRFPHPALRMVEAPQIESLLGGRPPEGLVRRLVELEKRYHASIGAPDVIAVLKVDPEVAVARKTDETPESVRRRSTEIWNVDWVEAGVHVVDASQSKEAVLADLKAFIWSELG